MSDGKIITEERRGPHLVRETCGKYKSKLVRLGDDATYETFIQDVLPPAKELSNIYAMAADTNEFPELTFQSAKQKAGFLSLAHALDFGSGFRPHLHKYRGQGAWLCIREGLVELGKRAPEDECDGTAYLKSITLEETTDMWKCHEEELRPLAKMLHDAIQEIASHLDQHSMDSLGSWVHHVLQRSAEASSSGSPSVVDYVEALVEAFPITFRDEYVMEDGQRVCLYKKAQLVASEVHIGLQNEKDEPNNVVFQFHDYATLTAFVDNVVVAVCRKYELIVCGEELNKSIDELQPLSKGSEEEVGLRSMGLNATEKLATMTGLTPGQIANYMWGTLGKTPENRKFARHLTPDTLFY